MKIKKNKFKESILNKLHKYIGVGDKKSFGRYKNNGPIIRIIKNIVERK